MLRNPNIMRAFENEVQEPYNEERARLGLVDASGFSLDPAYDYAGLAAALAKPTLAELLELLLARSDMDFKTAMAILGATKFVENYHVACAAQSRAGSRRHAQRGSCGAAAAAPPQRRHSSPILCSNISLAGVPGRRARKLKDSAKPDELPFLRLKKLCEDRERAGDRNAALAAYILR